MVLSMRDGGPDGKRLGNCQFVLSFDENGEWKNVLPYWRSLKKSLEPHIELPDPSLFENDDVQSLNIIMKKTWENRILKMVLGNKRFIQMMQNRIKKQFVRCGFVVWDRMWRLGNWSFDHELACDENCRQAFLLY